ncbi:hypothetical protein [Halobacillus kuroshimensis]|uniref:hypothetical protein n=1 Tax=Halobacillus kuroshimensis TaxID=302481 RepID=UPI00040057D6|nr:hypothetical protein [Halobacillus kuroshimensis]
MKQVVVLLFFFLFFGLASGCSQGESVEKEEEITFATDAQAEAYFLDDHAESDVEAMLTTSGEKLWIVRSGNHTYSIFGLKERKEEYAIVRVSAQLSLHNTIGGGMEVSSPHGTDYTVLLVKKERRKDLAGPVTVTYLPIFNGEAEAAVHNGHILDAEDAHSGESAVESSETIQ